MHKRSVVNERDAANDLGIAPRRSTRSEPTRGSKNGMLYESMKSLPVFSNLTNDQLLTETSRLAANERGATVALIGAIAEVDSRRLYLGEGCSSLFTYCTRLLHLSEHAAYGRIEAARAARRFPLILELLGDGSVTLTSISLLVPHLTHENHARVLGEARHKSKREVEQQVAALRPQPSVPSVIRRLPERSPSVQPGGPTAARAVEDEGGNARAITSPPVPRPIVKPLAPELFKIQFTVSRETHDKLRRAQDLLRHSIPNGDPAAIFERALTLLLADIERRKFATAARPRTDRPAGGTSRHIPASVKRAVWKRDAGQCAFVGTRGRCEERGFLEFHHVEPYAAGGATTVENLELRCRAHNAHEAELFFGALDGSLVRETRAGYAVETRSGPSELEGRSMRNSIALRTAITSSLRRAETLPSSTGARRFRC